MRPGPTVRAFSMYRDSRGLNEALISMRVPRNSEDGGRAALEKVFIQS